MYNWNYYFSLLKVNSQVINRENLFLIVKSKEKFKIQSFERHSQILRIILILDSKKKKLNFQSFIDNKGISSTTLYRTIATLKEMKLIESTIDNTKYPSKNIISLTDKGKKVAEYLKKIEEILERD